MLKLAGIALVGSFLATLAPAPQEPTGQILLSGTGPHQRPVDSSSALARQYVVQGLNLLYGFNHDEARLSVRTATEADPKCAMAWWGLALANGPHINFPVVTQDQAKESVEALSKASGLVAGVRPVDRRLIEAAVLRYASPQPDDRAPLDRAYAEEMARVWREFPKDPDVGALYAESLMDLRPWDLWKPDGTPQPGTETVTATLTEVLRLNPDHPMALHLAIHAWEASPTPEKADEASNRLRFLMPGLGHMVHMPSHIDVRRGRWQESIDANERAIKADENYRKLRPRQGFYRVYMAHNRHMLAFSAMMVGQSKKAIEAVDSMVANMPEAFVKDNASVIDGYIAMPLEARVRFGKWDEILAMPEYPEYLPITTTLRHGARAVAYAAKKQVPEAEAERAKFTSAKLKIPAEAAVGNSPAATVIAVAENMMDGEIALAKGETEEAVRLLAAAVREEDRLRYDEPPDWILPVRHALGVVLLDAGRPEEAEKVYRADLEKLPNNGWALNGLAESLRRQGKTSDAERMQGRFAAVWKDADMSISSSCMCLPNPK
ncbi:MAG TPA: tetratricopeptide repeat protein [Fimbriimonas sp.]